MSDEDAIALSSKILPYLFSLQENFILALAQRTRGNNALGYAEFCLRNKMAEAMTEYVLQVHVDGVGAAVRPGDFGLGVGGHGADHRDAQQLRPLRHDQSHAADAMRAARNAFVVLDWVNNGVHKSGLVLDTTTPTVDALTAALRDAPSLPGVKEFILQAMKDKAEAALIEADKVLRDYVHVDVSPAQPPGFSGIDGA